MRAFCNFVFDSSAKQWRCPDCGTIVPARGEQMPIANCGSRTMSANRNTGLRCDKRSEVAKQIPAKTLDCGCGSIALFRCDQYHELVSKTAIKQEGREVLQSLESEFRGRDCSHCEYRKQQALPEGLQVDRRDRTCPPYRVASLADVPRRVHFVTTLTASFAPGLRALLISLVERSRLPEFDFTVIALDHIEPRIIDELSSVANIDWIDRRELADTPDMRTSRPRLAPNFNKLLVWHLPYDHPCVFIDSDCLCVGSLTKIRYWRPQTVVRNFARREAQRRAEAAYQTSRLPIWNSGFFCFQPNRERGEAIVEYAQQNYATVALGDQEVLNDWFSTHAADEVQYADYAYNYRTYLGVRSDVKILHFAHPEKPWRDSPRWKHQRVSFDLWKSVAAGRGDYDRWHREFVPGVKG